MLWRFGHSNAAPPQTIGKASRLEPSALAPHVYNDVHSRHTPSIPAHAAGTPTCRHSLSSSYHGFRDARVRRSLRIVSVGGIERRRSVATASSARAEVPVGWDTVEALGQFQGVREAVSYDQNVEGLAPPTGGARLRQQVKG